MKFISNTRHLAFPEISYLKQGMEINFLADKFDIWFLVCWCPNISISTILLKPFTKKYKKTF